MSKNFTILVLILVCPIMIGNSFGQKYNPAIKYFLSSSSPYSHYRTFALVSCRSLYSNRRVDVIEDLPVMFDMQNCMEQIGYHHADSGYPPDLIVTVDYHPGHQLSDPDSLWIPKQLPQLSTGQGEPSLYYYPQNKFAELADTILTLPILPTEHKESEPVSIAIYDAVTRENIFFAYVAAGSEGQDIQIWRKHQIRALLKEFPMAKNSIYNYMVAEGNPGMYVAIESSDGKHFYPTIISKNIPNSPAEKAGIELFDVILEINGASVKNASYFNVVRRLYGRIGDTKDLKIWRDGKILTFNFQLVSSDSLK